MNDRDLIDTIDQIEDILAWLEERNNLKAQPSDFVDRMAEAD